MASYTSSSNRSTFSLHWPSVGVTLLAVGSVSAACNWRSLLRSLRSRKSQFLSRYYNKNQQQQQTSEHTEANHTTISSPSTTPSCCSSRPSPSPFPTASLSHRASALLNFFFGVGRCKVEKRTGWVNEGVVLPESVADHMFRMSVMALVCCNQEDSYDIPSTNSSANPPHRIDRFRAMQIALVHDLAEALVGDITPTQYSGVTKDTKHKLEADAMQQFHALLTTAHGSGGGDNEEQTASGEGQPKKTTLADYVKGLWEEYEAGATPTAQYVKNLDKLEMYLQAFEYQKAALARKKESAAAAAAAASAPTDPQRSPEEEKQLVLRLERFYKGIPATEKKMQEQDAAVEGGALAEGPQALLLEAIQQLKALREKETKETVAEALAVARMRSPSAGSAMPNFVYEEEGPEALVI